MSIRIPVTAKYLVLLSVSIISIVCINWAGLVGFYDHVYWQDIFNDSQITRGGKARNEISDYDLYAIVGYKYWHGDSPMRLHPEVPPLGKQIIGMGIQLFNNQEILTFLIGLTILILTYLLANQIFKDPRFSVAAALILSLNGSFRSLVVSSNLDLPQLFFLLVALYTFIKGFNKHYWFWLTSFSLGLAMATKFYFTGLLILGVFFLYLLMLRNFAHFMSFVSSLIFLLIGYIFPYIPALIGDPSLIRFLRFQRWLTNWWAGNSSGQFGSFTNMVLFGRWRTWWKDAPLVIGFSEWDVSWPLLFILGLVSSIKIIKKRNATAFLLWLCMLVFFIFFNLASPFPRYFVYLAPFLSILTVYWFKY